MLFNSYVFILVFLPLTVLGYFLLNNFRLYTCSRIFLCGMTLWFYGFYNPKHVVIILCSILINYVLACMLHKTDRKKQTLILGIMINAGILFYYKYYNFFIENVNELFRSDYGIHRIAIPLGISYFTFQQIAYLVDSYRGETEDHSFLDYVSFVLFFPQVSSGPIVLHGDLIPQFRDKSKKKVSYENLSLGLYIFACGLVKKVLIADTFGKAASWGFSNITLMSSTDAILVSLCYTFQLYFDFSGYSDMAIGIGKMLNIELPQNFNSPYKATSIVDFWGRWHMSLTRFFRKYVYFPLGGSKKGTMRTYLNIIIVFLLSGIWHGANWTFIVWGLLNGVCNCITKAMKDFWKRVPKFVQWLSTFFTVNFLWIIFRAADFAEAKGFILKIFEMKNFSISSQLKECLLLEEVGIVEKFVSDGIFSHISTLNMIVLFATAFVIIICGKNSSEAKYEKTIGRLILITIFLCWSIISLSGVSEFLYVDF